MKIAKHVVVLEIVEYVLCSFEVDYHVMDAEKLCSKWWWKQRVVSDVNYWLNVTCLPFNELAFSRALLFPMEILLMIRRLHGELLKLLEDFFNDFFKVERFIWWPFSGLNNSRLVIEPKEMTWRLSSRRKNYLMTFFQVQQFTTLDWVERKDLMTFPKVKELFNDPLPGPTVSKK